MKFAYFATKGSRTPRVGVLTSAGLVDIAERARSTGDTSTWLRDDLQILDLINAWPEPQAELSRLVDGATAISEKEVEFLPPVRPGKMLAIGRNYLDHAAEGGSAPPPAPLIFMKLPNSLTAHESPIVLPTISEQVDYEAELGVVIGKRAKRVNESDALAHVFGYTLVNDVSARDLQFGDGQWIRGKGLDTFAPLGPYITTRDEIADVQSLKIEGRLNGQTMQSSNTSFMIFKVAYLVSYISQGITLEPGDVIATGTPEGVGIFRKPPVLLKPGDTFEVEIEGLGTLRNQVVSMKD
jgi:2-keto-4-pentenoate hydratase/2-oxohepta-3-ene-1,7-dioic acid hydratase in catechol pathway